MRRKISRARASRLARTLAFDGGGSAGAGMAEENGDAPPPAQGAAARRRAASFQANPDRDAIIPTIGAAGRYDGVDWRTPDAATPDLRRSIGRAPRPRSASVGLEIFC